MASRLDDLESDLSAIHRIDRPLDEPAQRMFRLAYRLGHYPGIIRNELLSRARMPTAPTRETEQVTWVPPTADAVARSPLSRYISTSGGDQQCQDADSK